MTDILADILADLIVEGLSSALSGAVSRLKARVSRTLFGKRSDGKTREVRIPLGKSESHANQAVIRWLKFEKQVQDILASQKDAGVARFRGNDAERRS